MENNIIKNVYDLIDAVLERKGCIIFGAGRVGRMIGDDLEFLSYESALHKRVFLQCRMRSV